MSLESKERTSPRGSKKRMSAPTASLAEPPSEDAEEKGAATISSPTVQETQNEETGDKTPLEEETLTPKSQKRKAAPMASMKEPPSDDEALTAVFPEVEEEEGVVVERDGDDIYYEVDSIVGRKKIKGEIHYKVKWKNCTETTWEPIENLTEGAYAEAQAYDDEQNAKKKRKKLKHTPSKKHTREEEKESEKMDNEPSASKEVEENEKSNANNTGNKGKDEEGKDTVETEQEAKQEAEMTTAADSSKETLVVEATEFVMETTTETTEVVMETTTETKDERSTESNDATPKEEMPKHQGVFETVGKAIKKVIGTPRKGA